MDMFPFAEYLLAATLVLSLFALTHWSAKNNLPPMLRDELEKVVAGYGMARNHPAHSGGDRDSGVVSSRGPQCVEQSV